MTIEKDNEIDDKVANKKKTMNTKHNIEDADAKDTSSNHEERAEKNESEQIGCRYGRGQQLKMETCMMSIQFLRIIGAIRKSAVGAIFVDDLK